MFFRGWALHNVAETRPHGTGVALQRVPEAVRKGLNSHAQERMLDATCMELRFVPEAFPVTVTLCGLAGAAQAQVFFGDFQSGPIIAVGHEPVRIAIEPPNPWFLNVERRVFWGRTAFAHRVCRVYLSGGQIAVLDIAGRIRVPRSDEVPTRRYLAYGTSITQGAGSSVRQVCYAAQTARRLGADLINLGMGTSAHAETELADYVAGRDDWDIATLEPTANMQHFPLEEYERRLRHWLVALLARDCPRHVVCLTLFPQAADLGPAHVSPKHQGTPEEYREAMRRVAAACAHPRLHVLEGRDLLPDMSGLGPDLLHPKDNGHIQIGENLARGLTEILEGREPQINTD